MPGERFKFASKSGNFSLQFMCYRILYFKTRLIEYKTFKDKTLITQIHSSYFKGAKIELPNLQNYQREGRKSRTQDFFFPLILILRHTSFEGKKCNNKVSVSCARFKTIIVHLLSFEESKNVGIYLCSSSKTNDKVTMCILWQIEDFGDSLQQTDQIGNIVRI